MEGELSKFTNLLKGWQYRWFVLDSKAGTLTYYLCKEKIKKRGCLQLSNAIVSPCTEDSLAFVVATHDGEIYKLRASDVTEKQYWINILNCVAEFHGEKCIDKSPPQAGENLITQLCRSATLSLKSPPSRLTDNSVIRRSATVSYRDQFPRSQTRAQTINPIKDELTQITNALASVSQFQSSTIKALEDGDCNVLSPLDEQVLLLKATSRAMVTVLQQCFDILQKQSLSVPSGLPHGATIKWLESVKGLKVKSNELSEGEESVECAVDELAHQDVDFHRINQYADCEVEDKNTYTESELGNLDSSKSVILHLLSQVKLGMDLTRVLLPTFVLEKRSLLEMYADFLGHADLFIRISAYKTCEERMLAVLIFYLTSFHTGRKSAVAKKPYNPILGERFHCSMAPAPDTASTKGRCEGRSDCKNDPGGIDDESGRVYFVAEQVSHHPPVSAFYAECPTEQISMNCHIWTKSKFLGMSVGVINVGQGVISLAAYNEDYTFSFPNAYYRSILTVPWIELGGKTLIHCQQTGYLAEITFHTKPFHGGGKPNHITFVVKRPSVREGFSDVVCRGDGAWDGVIEMNLPNSSIEKKIIDVSSLEVTSKHVRPQHMQADNESRNVWSKVTEALLSLDVERASEEKHIIEQKQRVEAKRRQESGAEWKPKLFQRHADEWVFNPTISQIVR